MKLTVVVTFLLLLIVGCSQSSSEIEPGPTVDTSESDGLSNKQINNESLDETEETKVDSVVSETTVDTVEESQVAENSEATVSDTIVSDTTSESTPVVDQTSQETQIKVSGNGGKKNNLAPTIEGEPISVITVNSPYQYAPTISDPNGDKIRISGINIPSWLSLNKSTGSLSGTPGNKDIGIFSNIYLEVTDGPFKVTQGPFAITVQALTNTAPSISGIPTTFIREGEAYLFSPLASDNDNDVLTFSIANKPDDLIFNTKTGQLSGSFSYTAAGSHPNIQISVSDGALTASLAAFSIDVENVNRAPSISGNPPSTIAENSTYSFQLSANDPDGDPLSFLAINFPSWLSIDATTGKLSGIPTSADIGSYDGIQVKVSDGNLSSSTSIFSIVVTEKTVENNAPTISGLPASQVLVGDNYSFAPLVNDIDGDALTFSIANAPSWLKLSTNGILAGVPQDADIGKYDNIVLAVSDGLESAELLPFSIEVKAKNNPPTISGTPVTSATENRLYSFQVGANDKDNDPLIFSIKNKPSWASFDSSNGLLSGTPNNADIGVYENVEIAVSDNQVTVKLAAFSITVNQESTGGNQLSISNISRSGYNVSVLDIGNLTYVDRSYTIKSAPNENIQASYIQTKNDDKYSTGSSFLSFTIDSDANIYVALDNLVETTPEWLNTWQTTGATIQVSTNAIHTVYVKHFEAGTVTIGGNYGDGATSMYLVFAQMSSSSSVTPIAKPDFATTPDNADILIPVLNNDDNLSDTPITLTIEDGASHGDSSISDNKILYSPSGVYVGSDSINYRVTDKDGDFSISTINIMVTCSACVNDVTLELAWSPNPSEDVVNGYKVYFGKNQTFSNSPIQTISINDSNFNADSPITVFEAGIDFDIKIGDEACFKVSAYNSAGESQLSDMYCELM